MKCFNDIDFHLFVESLIKTIELKDAYTAGHSRRVSEISELICRGMNMPEYVPFNSTKTAIAVCS
jgi:HD-GYP domain-containing protein (c-di-GMP phosphodiesterase class II)